MPKLLLLVAIISSAWYWWSVFKRKPGDQRRPFLWRTAFWVILGLSIVLVATGRMHWLGAGDGQGRVLNTWADVLNRAGLGMEVMHERNAHNFPLDLASTSATPVALIAPAIG